MSFTRYVAQLEITPGLGYAPFWSAFIHLLRNAMEHQAGNARGQSTIRVSTCVANDQFSVTIEDDGPGADWAATEPSDRGAGLDAVRNACEALGGFVAIEPRKGEGTRISFTFPKQGAASEGRTVVLREAGKHGTSAA